MAIGGSVLGNIRVEHHLERAKRWDPHSDGRIVFGPIPGSPAYWVARSEYAALEQAMLAEDRSPVVCIGGRGHGKSSLAAAFVRLQLRDSNGPRLIAWTSGETRESFVSDLSQLADRLGISVDTEDAERRAEAVRDELNALAQPSLLIVDGAENAEELHDLLPHGGGLTRVLLTSTDRKFGQFATEIPVGLFDPDESLSYLLSATGLTSREGAASLAAELGHLPLALAVAASVIQTRHIGFASYLDRLREQSLNQALPPQELLDYPRSLWSAIQLSIETADNRDHLAAALLPFLAICAPSGIPLTLFVMMAQRLPDPYDIGEDAATDALSVINGVSLTSLSSDESFVGMHQMVSRCICEGLGDRSAGLVGAYIHYALRALQHTAESADVPSLSEWMAREIGAQAVSLLDRSAIDAVTEEQHLGILSVAGQIASRLAETGGILGALAISERVACQRELLLAPDDPETLGAQFNLGSHYLAAGREHEALKIFERIAPAHDRVFGRDHTYSGQTWLALSSSYQAAGRYKDSVTILERLLAVPMVSVEGGSNAEEDVRSQLAVAYMNLGRADEAIELLQMVERDADERYGPNHPLTMNSNANLAMCYVKTKRVWDGIVLFQTTFNRSVRARGPWHPDTLQLLSNQAAAYALVGMYEGAESMAELVLDNASDLGADHPVTRSATMVLYGSRALRKSNAEGENPGNVVGPNEAQASLLAHEMVREKGSSTVFDMFNASARRAVVLGRHACLRFGNDGFGTGHVLYGILDDERGNSGFDLMRRWDVSRDEVRAELEAILAIGAGARSDVGFDEDLIAAFSLAAEMGGELEHPFVGCHHLILGFVKLGRGEAFDVLQKLGVGLGSVEGELQGGQYQQAGTVHPRPEGPGLSSATVKGGDNGAGEGEHSGPPDRGQGQCPDE